MSDYKIDFNQLRTSALTKFIIICGASGCFLFILGKRQGGHQNQEPENLKLRLMELEIEKLKI
jgi:hypothetical protein